MVRRTRDCSTTAAISSSRPATREPPKTWDELKEMALKTAQDTGIQNGFVFQGKNYEGGVCNGLEYIRTHGGDVLSGERAARSS